MSSRPSVQTQFIVFVLFGDVVAPRGGWVWTSSLLQMLDVLGVSERAARSSLSRMGRKGWLKSERDGRHSLYTLTARGRRLVDEGAHRIFEPRQREWDGQWFLVVYSLPESRRRLRNDLRKRLSWLGFGRLAPGTWISPFNRRTDVDAMVDDLNARSYVKLFSGLHLANGDDRAIVEQCWNLRDLNRRYARFIARWERPYSQCAEGLLRGTGPDPAACFEQRFWITRDYSPFPREDPNLPDALLPERWLGTQASELFNNYRNLLNPRAAEFVEQVYQSANGYKH
jgi:phenylacetic acid degradation operon negative regulatory protein